MKVAKDNRVFSIAESEKNAYLQKGYDILDDNGVLIESHCKGTVSKEEYDALKKENAALKGQITKLKKELEKGDSAPERGEADG